MAPAGKRLAPLLPEIIEVLERTGERAFAPEVRAKLLRISTATIDRMLAPEQGFASGDDRAPSPARASSARPRSAPSRTETMPTRHLRGRPGAHHGGSGGGEFCQTLVLTCVATGWSETRVRRNKAQRWSFAAIVDIEATMPFPLLGLDSDDGSEFINDQLYRWCQADEVTFTRSRPTARTTAASSGRRTSQRHPALDSRLFLPVF